MKRTRRQITDRSGGLPDAGGLPTWIVPQLGKLVTAAPDGPEWLHEIKDEGYHMHAWIDRGDVRLLTRTGLDWTAKYPTIASALAKLPATTAYLDGDCAVSGPTG